GLVGVHHNGFAMFKTPGAFAHIQSHCVAAKLINRNVHRSPSAQGWIEKDKRDALSLKRPLQVVAGFDSRGELDHRVKLLAREVCSVEKVFALEAHRVWFGVQSLGFGVRSSNR